MAGNTQQEIRKIDAGLAAEEYKVAIQLGDGIGIDLIVVELRTELEGMRSQDFRKVVAHLKGVVDLPQLVGIRPDGEVVEIDAFDSFGFWRQRDDAGVFGPTTKPWEARLVPTPPTGWPRSVASRMKLK